MTTTTTQIRNASPLRTSTAALLAAGLFVVIFIAWGAIDAGALPESAFVPFTYVALLWHVAALLVVAGVVAPLWARAGGFGWALLDSAIDVLVINGVEQELWWPMRLGAHIGLGLWLAGASYAATGARRVVGYIAAATTVAYSLTAPYVPEQALMPAMGLIVAWLVMTGVHLRRTDRQQRAP